MLVAPFGKIFNKQWELTTLELFVEIKNEKEKKKLFVCFSFFIFLFLISIWNSIFFSLIAVVVVVFVYYRHRLVFTFLNHIDQVNFGIPFKQNKTKQYKKKPSSTCFGGLSGGCHVFNTFSFFNIPYRISKSLPVIEYMMSTTTATATTRTLFMFRFDTRLLFFRISLVSSPPSIPFTLCESSFN